MKQALLAVSFGTSVPRARQDIEAVERVLAAGAPERAFCRAYTSPTIRRILAERGEPVSGLPEALEALAAAGGEDVAVQPTHLLYGFEYDKLKADAAAFAGRFARLALGRPLAADSESLRALAACMVRRFGQPEGGALVLLGHGTEHFANMVYPAMQTALRLAEQGVEPVIIEKEAELGGKLRGWHVLFPSFTPASEILTELRRRIAERGIEVMTRTEARGFSREGVQLPDGRMLACDSVVVCSGFTLFDASIKEEYGYGIYDNVFTTVDIERMLNEGRVAKADGSRPRRIAFLHCVGSRDEKVCQQHCSKVCCITGVKQAMEMRQMFPEADVFNFYMDIRMFGPGYEEMYREAQQKYNIHFIRGRISEASPMIDGRVQIKAEDTLTGRPLRMSVDMLILIVGMRANDDNAAFAEGAGLNRAPSGFMAPRDMFLGNVKSNVEGIFYAGTVTAPKNIGESLNEGTAAADAAARYVGV